MKFVTITAVLGALVAIPFIFGRRKPEAIPVTVQRGRIPTERDTNLRYDVDDFLTEP